MAMRAAIVALLIVVSTGCSAGPPLQNDMRGLPAAVPTGAQKSSLSDLESQIAGIQSQIEKLKAAAAKIEEVVAALQALMPEIMAVLSRDPDASFTRGSTWLAFLSDAIAVCHDGRCDSATLTHLETLCRTYGALRRA